VQVELGRRPRAFVRALGLAVVTLLGAWLGLTLIGSEHTSVGPMDTEMALRPSFTGGTRINISPLGSLQLDSHHAPIALNVDVDRLDPDRSEELVEHPERITGLQDEVTHDVRRGTLDLGVRSGIAVLLGATALGLVVYRRPRRAMAAGGLAVTLLAVSGAVAWATWNPKSVLEPKYSGLLSSAPSVVGNARSIVSDFNVYGQELARLVTNVSKLYDVTSTLPAYQPDPTTMRVLWVSDIHLNPASWDIIRSLIKQYDVAMVIDTGDTMDHGTAAENRFLDPIATLGVPYVWVRGNHDSLTTQAAMAGKKNAVVVDNAETVTVRGLHIAGIGDPQFTPDRAIRAAGNPAEEAAGRKLAAAIKARKDAHKPVDIAITHEPRAAREADGLVPLALAGHLHHRRQYELPGGTRLMLEGSAGGGGLRALEQGVPEKVTASILYLDRDTKLLQAWDEITLGGLGRSTAEVSRHLPKENTPGGSSPSPSLSPPEARIGDGGGTRRSVG
jgi:predicted MPP superfamily phosphohydrolase